MKRLALIVVLLVGTVGAFQFLSQGYFFAWEPRVRSYLEETAGRVTKTRVHIDGIALSFFHRIRLINVRVTESQAPYPVIFQASQIELTISLIDLPRAILHRKAYEAVGLITLENPWLRLSKDTLARHASTHKSTGSLPPWFTLAWEGGTIQWLDPDSPRKAWTLYQAQGAFRVRGPQTNFSIRGAVQEARTLRFQLASLGHRWNAQLYLTEAETQNVLSVAQTVLHRAFLPAGWTTRGHFDFEGRASGRQWPERGDDWTHYVDQLTLSFTSPTNAPDKSAESVNLSGTLRYEKGSVTTQNFNFKTPWMDGMGHAELAIEGDRGHPQLTLSSQLASGRLGWWPYQNALIKTRYVNDHWEFLENTVDFLGGRLSAKGYIASTGSDLTITADSMSLSTLGENRGIKTPSGKLNASCTLKGPLNDWRLAGALWMTQLQWGPSTIGDARGDFEVTPLHFQAQAMSDKTHFRFALDGNRSDRALSIERFEVYLPSGGFLTADGQLWGSNQRIEGTLDMGKISFPDDLPFLPTDHVSMKGIVDGHARLSGTRDNPTLKATVQSPNLSIEERPLGKASATVLWTKTKIEIPTFRLESGVEGQWTSDFRSPREWSLDLLFKQAPAVLLSAWRSKPWITEGTLDGKISVQHHADWNGKGNVTLQNASVGPWHVNRSTLRYDLRPEQLTIHELTADIPQALLRWAGTATWKKGTAPPKTIAVKGQGQLQSATASNWEIPLLISGDILADSKGWSGNARVQSPRPLLKNKPVDPIDSEIRWNAQELAWTNTHWGRHWTSKGSLRLDKQPAVWSAQIKATQVSLKEWQPLLWPKATDELQGLLSGTFDLSGSQDQPIGKLDLHLEDGRWRAFLYSVDLQGTWDHGGLKPLKLNGRFKSGGDFQFSGFLSPESQAQGSLKLNGFNLKPLGESLRFPKPLEGSASATLTLSGPLSSLSWNGHLDASPIIYSPASEHPFKLEQVNMDLTLVPVKGSPAISHLTLTEGQAKTAEELIRFKPGSFVEFAADQPARLQVGTEIRNLHLGIFTLFGGLDLDGTWQIKPEGFAVQTKAHTHSLFINDYELEEGLVLADYYNGNLKFQKPLTSPSLVTGAVDFHKAPQLKFTDFFISGKDRQGLQLTGDIGPALWDFHMKGQSLDMGILGELSGFPYPLSGAADVQVHGTGDTLHPHVDGQVSLEHGTVLGLAFDSGKAAFNWQDTRITFTKLLLSDSGRYNLEGSGVFPLLSKTKSAVQNHPIDFSLRLRDSNLSLLQSLSQEVKQAKGPIEGLVQITGTLEDPSLRGSVHIVNGEILGAHYFRQLRNAGLHLEFEGDKINVRDLHGKSGDGEFKGSGTITLSGFQPSKYDLTFEVVSSRGLEVQVPELAIPESPLAKRFRFLTTASKTDVRGKVTLRGPADAPVFSGVGIFSNGHFTFPPSHKNPPNPAVLEWFRRITWDVDLNFQDGAWFENELVQASVVGKMKLKGPSDKLRVDGGLDIPEGKISYLGLQFEIQQARYDIRSDVSGDTVVNTPYVRGAAESQIQAVDTINGVAGSSGGGRLNINDTITLNIDYAPVDQIKPRLTSAANPNLSQEKVLARATQTDIENLTPQERNSLYTKQIVSMIDSSLTTPLAQNVLKKTGIADRVRVQHVVDPNNSITGQNLNTSTEQRQQSTGVNLFANTKYTIEKDLSNRLSLGYGVRFIPTAAVVEEGQQQQKLDLVSDVQLSYRWFRNIYLRGDFDLPNSNPNILPERKVTIEPRWRFGWWGNTNKSKEKPKPVP